MKFSQTGSCHLFKIWCMIEITVTSWGGLVIWEEKVLIHLLSCKRSWGHWNMTKRPIINVMFLLINVLCAAGSIPEPQADLFSSVTSIQCMQVTGFCIGNMWRISAFSTPHRTTCLVSPRLKANTGVWQEDKIRTISWSQTSISKSKSEKVWSHSLLLPSGLQASAVISLPVYSLGGKLQTRWKLAKRCSSN